MVRFDPGLIPLRIILVLHSRHSGRTSPRPRLARESMGEAYRAHDSRTGRDVAMKILPADDFRLFP
jgi:hypothetical protein